MIDIINFSKAYDKNKYVIKKLNLKVNDGEIFGFVGHNGAGKTTLIKSICGIQDFNEGDIIINNISIKDDPYNCKKYIFYIPDNPEVYNTLKGIQYLNFIADVYNIDINKRKEVINKYSKEFEIENDLNNLIGSYSRGMKQKLIIIGSLIANPKLLVLDEPFVGLDPIASHKLKEIMKSLTLSGSTVFFSSHVLEVVEKLCDRIAIIKKGEIVKVGTIKEITNESLESFFIELNE